MLPNFHFSIERWRKNEEYGVWVSTHGRVRLIKNKEFLNVRIDQRGYCTVFTEKGGQYVHRLVAYTWLGGKRNEKYNVDHINSNKRDNSVKNLRWIEVELNTEYARFTQTDTIVTSEIPTKNAITIPQISAVEKDEDFINTLTNENIWNNFKEVDKLFSNEQIYLYAGNYCLHNCSEITSILKLSNTPKRINLIERVTHAISTNTQYCGYYWRWSPANKLLQDNEVNNNSWLEQFYKSNDNVECGKIIMELLNFKKIILVADGVNKINSIQQLYKFPRTGNTPPKNELFERIAHAIKSHGIVMGHTWELEEK